MSDEPQTVRELAAQMTQEAMSKAFANTVNMRNSFPVDLDLPQTDSVIWEPVPGTINRYRRHKGA